MHEVGGDTRERRVAGVHVLNALLLALLIGGSLAVFPELPERYASHFRMDGTPDGWSRKSLLGWMLLPLIGLATAALQYGIAAYLPRQPRWLNIPQKERLLALPPERQRPVLAHAARMLHWMTAMVLALFLLIAFDMYRGAMSGTGGRGFTVVVLIYSLVVMPVTLWSFIARMQSELDRQWREQQLGRTSAGI